MRNKLLITFFNLQDLERIVNKAAHEPAKKLFWIKNWYTIKAVTEVNEVGNDRNSKEGSGPAYIVNRIMPVAMVLMLLVSLIYLFAGETVLLNDRGVSSRDCVSLDSYFDIEQKDGRTESITLPGTYEQYGDDELTLAMRLTGDKIDEWFMIWNMGHEMYVYVDDELRLSVNNEGRRLFKGDVAYQYDFVPLKEADEGKTLRICFPNYAGENHQLGSVYIGDKAALLLKAVKPYQFTLILAMVLAAFGIGTILKVIFVPGRAGRSYELFYMSLGVTIASAWFLFNSPAAQFVFPNVETARDSAFFFASMIPLPFLMYIERLFKGRYAIVFTVLKLVSLLSFIIMVTGFLFTDISINDLFISTEISAVASLGITFALITGDIQNHKIREYYIAATGITGFIALALIYVIIYILFPFRGDGGLILLTGILLLYVTSLLSYTNSSDKLN